MGIEHIKETGDEVEITIRVKLDKKSMLKSEESIEKSLNEAGVAIEKIALKKFDTDGRPIELNGKILTSKGQQKKSIKENMGK